MRNLDFDSNSACENDTRQVTKYLFEEPVWNTPFCNWLGSRLCLKLVAWQHTAMTDTDSIRSGKHYTMIRRPTPETLQVHFAKYDQYQNCREALYKIPLSPKSQKKSIHGSLFNEMLCETLILIPIRLAKMILGKQPDTYSKNR